MLHFDKLTEEGGYGMEAGSQRQSPEREALRSPGGRRAMVVDVGSEKMMRLATEVVEEQKFRIRGILA